MTSLRVLLLHLFEFYQELLLKPTANTPLCYVQLLNSREATKPTKFGSSSVADRLDTESYPSMVTHKLVKFESSIFFFFFLSSSRVIFVLFLHDVKLYS